ncbi:unnamed protein product [Trifolium pratense]|uniref:Uncharacterized protein n=1 Tax=Trifolium pratense TaxID=57577 RepID=A0ACB0J9U7_TRIPR|nr:unnamed protein product [Trifolium pratense]
MASSSNSAKEAEAESTKLPNWVELPIEITANILGRLDTIDIVTNVCHVCPLWWNIFKYPLMWRSIRMNNILNYVPYDFHCVKSAYRDMNLLKIFFYAVHRSCGNLEVVDIEHFATDDLLHSVANNARNLRCLRLVHCWRISDEGFRKNVIKLQYLEELNISLMLPSHDSLVVLARSCPLLKSLTFLFADPLHQVGGLDNGGDYLTEIGWLAILDRCHLLESIDIHNCGNLYLSESLMKRFQEQIKDMRLPQSYWKIHDGQLIVV